MIFNDAMFLDGKQFNDYRIVDFAQNGTNGDFFKTLKEYFQDNDYPKWEHQYTETSRQEPSLR